MEIAGGITNFLQTEKVINFIFFRIIMNINIDFDAFRCAPILNFRKGIYLSQIIRVEYQLLDERWTESHQIEI